MASISTSQLRTLWHRYYHVRLPKGLSRDLLIRFIAHRLQEEAFGGLGKTTLRRLETLGARPRCPDKADRHCLPVSLRPETTLVREWNGSTHMVQVLEDGFEYRGERFPSLTKVAAAISGPHRSGPAFFGLKRSAFRFAEKGRGLARTDVRSE